MQIISELAGASQISDTAIRELVRKRINDLGGEEFDTTELGYFVILDSTDTLEDLETQLGFSIVANRITGIRWNQPGFTPSFEFIEAIGHGLFYDMVIVLSDSGYGVEILIPNKVGGDVDLLAMCAKYATPPFPDDGPP
jgi:hypothetical protein